MAGDVLWSSSRSSILRHLRKRGIINPDRAVAALKAAHEEQGTTLADVSAATGIKPPTLPDLETGRNDNPTLRTLMRDARAVNRKIVIGLIEADLVVPIE